MNPIELVDLVTKLNDQLYEKNPGWIDEFGSDFVLETNGEIWAITFFDMDILSSFDNYLYDEFGDLIDIEKVIKIRFNNLISELSKCIL
jgi:hypothetical protein